VANERLITRVYFPRLVIPMSAVLAGLLDFAVAFVVLIGMMLLYGIVPTIAIVTLPLFLLLAVTTALGVGLWLSALNVQYRDVRYTIPAGRAVSIENEMFPAWVGQGLYGYQSEGRFIDIGTSESYMLAEQFFATERPV
jgi:hypothetical protein